MARRREELVEACDCVGRYQGRLCCLEVSSNARRVAGSGFIAMPLPVVQGQQECRKSLLLRRFPRAAKVWSFSCRYGAACSRALSKRGSSSPVRDDKYRNAETIQGQEG